MIKFNVSLIFILFYQLAWTCTDMAMRDMLISYHYDTCGGCDSTGYEPICFTPFTRTAVYEGSTIVYLKCRISFPNNPSYDYDRDGNSYYACSDLSPKESPPPNAPDDGPSATKQCSGSLISVDTQTLGESVQLVGVPFDLVYSTDLIFDRISNRKVTYRISDMQISSSTTGYRLYLQNEENFSVLDTTFNPAANLSYSFTWNGNLHSGQPAEASVRYQYTIDEANPNGNNYPIRITGFTSIGNLRSEVLGLGHWLPSVFLYYDFESQRIVRPTGETTSVSARYNSSTTFYEAANSNGSEFYEFYPNGRIYRIKYGLTGQTKYQFSYNSSNHLTSIVDGFGKTTTFNRDTNGKWISITTPYGKTIGIDIDTSGRIVKLVQPSLEEYEMTYHGSTALLASFEKPNGAVNTFLYDSDGNLTQNSHSGGYVQNLLSVATSTRERKVEYSHSGKSAVVTVTNDATSKIRKVEDPTAPTESITYGSTIGSVQQGGYYSQRTYQFSARFPDYSRFPASSMGGELGINYLSSYFTESVTLNNSNDPFSIINWTVNENKFGYITAHSYNGANRKWTSTTPQGKTSNFTLDLHERVTQTQIGNLTATDFTYTDENLTQVQQGTRTTIYNYSSTTGLLTSLTDSLSQTVSFTYDANERVASITGPDSQSILLSYNSVGQLVSITPAGRPAHNFSFNGSELVSQYTPPTTSLVTTPQTTYTYDANRIKTVTRPDGKVITYNYDSVSGLLTSVASNEATITVTIDAATNLPYTLTSPDRFGLQIMYTGRIPSTVYTYEPNGSGMINYYSRNFDSVTGKISSDTIYSNGVYSINYAYNNDHDLSQAGDMTYNYSYPNGLLTTVVSGVSGDQIETKTYNSYGELLTQTTAVGSNQVHQLVLTYDNLGRIKTKQDIIPGVNSPAYDYTYDNLGRLTEVKDGSATITTYTYDLNGNRTQKVEGSTTTNYTYDNQDRMLTAGVYTFTYNHYGEMTSRTNTLLNQTTNYTYDSFGNLTQVDLPNGDVITYEIDTKNRRIGKRKNGILQVRYIYMDDLRIAAEIDSNSTLKRRFVYGSKQNIPEYYIEGNDKFRIVTDQLGTPRVIFDMSTGSVVAKLDHDEFGIVKTNTNTNLKLPFGFAGGLMDWDTGLLRFGARDYDPALGRWLSKDPILFEGGDTNLYGYVMNDPVNWIDPEGTRFIRPPVGPRVPITPSRGWNPPPPPRPVPPPNPPGVPKDQGPIDPPDLQDYICRRYPSTCRRTFGELPPTNNSPGRICTPDNLSGR